MNKTCVTHYNKIYMAGDIGTAAYTCRKYCDDVGLCVRIYPSIYIYTGGSESGFCVQLINYPKFESTLDVINEHGKRLAELLLEACEQKSYSIETPYTTEWYDKSDE